MIKVIVILIRQPGVVTNVRGCGRIAFFPLIPALWPVIVMLSPRALDGRVKMSDENDTIEKTLVTFPKKKVLIVIGIAIGIAVVCFALVVILPRPEEPLFKNPLRSLLTGLGLLGVACPLCIIGSILGKRATTSPYFEEAFITTVFNVFGFICLILGLICIGLSIYTSLRLVFGSG